MRARRAAWGDTFPTRRGKPSGRVWWEWARAETRWGPCGHGVAAQPEQTAQREGFGARGDALPVEGGEALTPELLEGAARIGAAIHWLYTASDFLEA